MGPNQTYELLYREGNHQQNEKTVSTERKCKWCNQQGLNFQNIQTAHTTQQPQNNLIWKWHENMLTILIIIEMQIKTTTRYHLTLVRIV